jgi:hypothetical protein
MASDPAGRGRIVDTNLARISFFICIRSDSLVISCTITL